MPTLLDLPGPSRRIRVEPLRIPAPAEPSRPPQAPAEKPGRAPAEPPAVPEPAPA